MSQQKLGTIVENENELAKVILLIIHFHKITQIQKDRTY